MSHSPPPPPAMPLACQHDPERWFDRRHRAAALAGCLGCAVRPWCAAQALKCRATHGMWAGIWIDEHHDAAAPRLQAIAADDAAPGAQRPTTAVRTDSAAAAAPAPLHRPAAPVPSGSLSATVLARSSGHCEVFAEDCRYTLDRYVKRCPSASRSLCAAEVFGACTACADSVAGLQPHLADALGYVVSPGRDPASAPFYWRGSRWVLLSRDGWLTEIRDDAQTA